MNIIFGTDILLWDSAHPCSPWMYPPYKHNGNLTNQQNFFSYRYFAVRIATENSIDFLVQCIIITSVLHKICIDSIDHWNPDTELWKIHRLHRFRQQPESIKKDNGYIIVSDAEGNILINKTYKYFSQIQLYITKRNICYLLIWTPNEVVTVENTIKLEKIFVENIINLVFLLENTYSTFVLIFYCILEKEKW